MDIDIDNNIRQKKSYPAGTLTCQKPQAGPKPGLKWKQNKIMHKNLSNPKFTAEA